MEQVKSIVGPPIYTESLLTAVEYLAMSKIYSTYINPAPPRLHNFDSSSFKWRYEMGKTLSFIERSLIEYRFLLIINAAKAEQKNLFQKASSHREERA